MFIVKLKTILLHCCIALGTTVALAQTPVIDGNFDGTTTWGTATHTADQISGWASANAKKMYVTTDDCYLYLGAEVTASTWMNWVFLINTTNGGGTTDSWSRQIDYTHSDAPDYIFRGHFDGYAEFHTWNGSDWDGIGNAIDAADFGGNVTSNVQNGWIEVRILKSSLNNPVSIDVQFYIAGDKDEHGSFDAIPNDENAISWNETNNRTPLNNYKSNISLAGSALTTVSPAFPSPSNQVTINFNATCSTLAGASKVYLHSGVSTTPNSPNNFDVVIGNWGQDDGVGEMTNLGNNQWQITLSTSLLDYYGLAATDDVFGLNFLFRSADGVLKEDNNGNNYFTAVNTGDYFTINTPAYSPFLVEQGVPFDAVFTASSAPVSWTLEKVDANNMVISQEGTQTGGITYTQSLTVPNTAIHRYKITATFNDITKHKFFEAKGFSTVVEAARPFEEPGIYYDSNDPTKATLILHAPTYTYFYDGNGVQIGTNPTTPKNAVYAIGDFNDWEINESYLMKRDRDGWNGATDADSDNDRGDYWWIELMGLTPGQPYVFQYFMDGGIQVADPYAEQISDIDDANIPAAIYPDLPTYPTEADDRASVLQTAQTDYIWEASSFTPPAIDELLIYELHFRDFTEEGTYLAAIDRLEYLENLGINAIHVLPVSEFEGNSSWGYNPNFYFAPDKYYGTKNDLKKFIDECHKREILVFNDLVLNHAFYSNVMARMYWNEELTRPADDNPWFNPTHKMVRNMAGWWGADWNHASQHTQEMVDRAIDFWLQEYHFDGFRFDFTKGIGQTDPNDFPFRDDWASSFNQDRIDLLERMVNGMKSRNPGAIAIFEHLANADEDKVLADQGILMWSGVGHHNDVKGFILGYDSLYTNIYDSGVFVAKGFQFPHWMSYPESHDEERLAYELSQYYAGNDSTDTEQEQVAKMIDRLKIGWAFNLFLPGPRMIWQFAELGYDVNINFNGRTGEKPIRWEYYDDSKRRELYNLITKILYLRRNYNGIYDNINASNHTNYIDYGNIGLGAGKLETPRYMRLTDLNGNYIIVMANLDPDNSHSYTFGFPTTGTWYLFDGSETTDGTTVNVTSTSQTYNLPPSELLIWTNFKLPCMQKLAIKVLLQGNYETGNGSIDSLIPRKEPFTDLGFVHAGRGGGETITTDVWTVTGDDAIIDWVLVELRDKSNNNTILATRAALLQKDGDVVDVDGVSPLEFFVESDNYYVVVNHRNHAAVMTSSIVKIE